MPRKQDPKSDGSAHPGRKGSDLALRYMAGENALGSEIFKHIDELTSDYLKGRVRQSRLSYSGVFADRDDGDILAQVARDVFKALNSGKYKDGGRFDHFVMKLAHNCFIDALSWKRKRKQKPTDGAPSVEPGEVSQDTNLSKNGEDPKGRASSGEARTPHLELREGDEPFAHGDEATFLLEKEILNIILQGLRTVENEEAREVWTARALLGKNEAELGRLYGLKPDTCTSHYRRASEEILEHIHQHPDYEGVPLEGLREVVRQRLHLSEADLSLIEGEDRREALRLAASQELSLNELGERLNMSPEAALQTLQEAIAALAKAKVRRLKPIAFREDAAGDDWLWKQVGHAIDSFPKPPVQARANGEPAPGYGELAALGEIAVLLGFSRDGAQPAKTLTELVGPRVIKEGFDAAAKSLGTSRERLMSLLSGSAGSAPIEPELLARLSSHYGLEAEDILAAARASSQSTLGLRTRAMSDDERKKYLEGLRRRVLGPKAGG